MYFVNRFKSLLHHFKESSMLDSDFKRTPGPDKPFQRKIWEPHKPLMNTQNAICATEKQSGILSIANYICYSRFKKYNEYLYISEQNPRTWSVEFLFQRLNFCRHLWITGFCIFLVHIICYVSIWMKSYLFIGTAMKWLM